jgi:hypothetical protein
MTVVEKARGADGCLDFAITADLLDPAVSTSLSAGSRNIVDVQPLFGKGRA